MQQLKKLATKVVTHSPTINYLNQRGATPITNIPLQMPHELGRDAAEAARDRMEMRALRQFRPSPSTLFDLL
ncbi:hypothetical protein [Chromobacterium vaccinii]|uniref:hypothetical protein n=1 Tax=Chromobacterium vaccinii TaxID=1108595 RepID=UPI0031D77701